MIKKAMNAYKRMRTGGSRASSMAEGGDTLLDARRDSKPGERRDSLKTKLINDFDRQAVIYKEPRAS